MADDDSILVADTGQGVRVLTLNRPAALNAIDMAMAERLALQLELAGQDPSLRCLIVTGAGDKAFSAGFDIREMAGFDPAAMREAFVRPDPLFLQIAQHRLPVIAALNGLAHGAGALLAAACDLRVACAATAFKVTAINYGSANATWSLPRIVGAARAKDILMTGRSVGADEGLRIGLFDRLAQDVSVLDAALELAAEIAAKPAGAVQAVKALVDGAADRSLEAGWRAEHEQVLAALEAQESPGSAVFRGFLGKRSRGE
jgi:enoyl-CoA hydratase/carnithine racemase